MSALPRTATEKIKLPSGEMAHVPKCLRPFEEWHGQPVPRYGGKALLTLGDGPLFAELVVLRLLEGEGWEGVWVDSYGRKYWKGMRHVSEPVEVRGPQRALLDRIRTKAGCRGGCLDVFAWRGEKVRFVELKRRGEDRIRETQKHWIEAARSCGIRMSDLLIVEWWPEERGGRSSTAPGSTWPG